MEMVVVDGKQRRWRRAKGQEEDTGHRLMKEYIAGWISRYSLYQ